MKVDYKITTWERFDIDNKHKDALLAFLKENPKASAMEILDWAFDIGDDPCPRKIRGSDEEMTPEENDGYSTIEVLDHHCGEVLFHNGKKFVLFHNEKNEEE